MKIGKTNNISDAKGRTVLLPSHAVLKDCSWIFENDEIIGGFCQTNAWAEIVKEIDGHESYWVQIGNRQLLPAGVLVTHKKHKGANKGQSWREFLFSYIAPYPSLEINDGPILVGSEKAKSLSALLGEVEDLAMRLHVQEIRFNGLLATNDCYRTKEIREIFRNNEYNEIEWSTSLVDLRKEEEEIFKSFKHATRKGIRKCEKSGVEVAECKSLEAISGLFCEGYADGDADSPIFKRVRLTWEVDGGRHYRFFVAKDAAGRVLATLGTYSFNGLATEIMSHRTKESFEDNLPAQDLLHWEIFKAHKAAGDISFNLAGYSPDPATPKQAGIRRFKEKWGGREVSVPKFVKRFPSLSQRAWGLLKTRRLPSAGVGS